MPSCQLLSASGILLAAAVHLLASRGPVAAQAPAPAPAVSCRASGPLAPRTRLNVTLQSGGLERSFLLSLPDNFATAQPALLLALHGAGTKAEQFLDGGPSTAVSGASPGTQLDVKGTAARFVVATPQGIRGGAQSGAEATQRGGGAQALVAAAAAKVSSLGARLLPARRWSNATSEGDPLHAIESTEQFDAPDDVAFMRDVATCVRDGLRVGISDHVFVAGWSQGSKLGSSLVCALQFSGAQGGGFSVAALAVGAGLAAETCPASVRTPLLLLQGGSDDLVPFCHSGAPYKATRVALNAWAQARGCPQLGARDGWRSRCGAQGDGGDTLRVYAPAKCDRPDAAPLALYWLPKLPHDVPSGDLPGLAGGFGDLVVGFLRSVRDGGAGDTAPLRSAAPGQPPLAACSGSDPCS